jgi:Spy/CpxP family protein refolding chaperone
MNRPQGLLLALLLTLGIATTAWAAPPAMAHRPGFARGRGARMAAIMQKLDLSPGQRARMRELHQRQARRDIQTRAELQTARLDLREMMTSGHPERGAINAQIDKLARLRADQQKDRVATMMEARDILTPEQREKLRDMRGAGMGMGMRNGGGMGDGPRGMRGGMRGRMHGTDDGGDGEHGDAQ